MKFKQLMEGVFCKDMQKEKDFLANRVEQLNNIIREMSKENVELIFNYNKQIDIINELTNENLMLSEQSTPVDLFCKSKNYLIDNRAYKDKIIINNISIDCDLREIFTPNSYIVKRFKEKIITTYMEGAMYTKLNRYKSIMNAVNKAITWTADGRYDNYFYPNYTLKVGAGDCDDSAFLQMSIEPELAVAFGFVKKENSWEGHAFAVGIIDNTLVVFDAVYNRSEQYVNEGEEFKNYKINYIITKNNVYVVDGTIKFGDLLWS